MTKSNRYFLAASVSAAIGLSASAGGNHYPDVKSSSANSNSATHARLQDPTNPQGAYDTDKSGYANRWNAEDRISSQPLDQTHWQARGVNADRPVSRTTTTESYQTTRSSADLNDKGMYQGAYTGVSSDSDKSGRAYRDTDHTTVNTSMSGAEVKTDTKANEASDTAYRADNTGLNKRDRNENADTADKQAGKGTKNDVELTRKIRRELTKDDSLSTYGKNVKIITQDGMATLRGPVTSSEEKDKIESAAGRIVGTQKVRNELEIKH